MEGDINDKYQKCPILLKLSTVQQNEKKKQVDKILSPEGLENSTFRRLLTYKQN